MGSLSSVSGLNGNGDGASLAITDEPSGIARLAKPLRAHGYTVETMVRQRGRLSLSVWLRVSFVWGKGVMMMK